MQNILEVTGLSKKYNQFSLENVDITLPRGSIMGFIGENGAGKTTTIKLILNLIHRDAGNINVFGMDAVRNEKQIKEDIGVVLDECFFQDNLTATDVSRIMKSIYKRWDGLVFRGYMEKFQLPSEKKIKDFSKGMKMKLSLAVALSHHAKFLILDEATSGLDPIIRNEILDVFLEFIQDEQNAIFLSSHITSDIEKISDYITFIHHGKIIFSKSKDELLYEYGLLKCSSDDFEKIDKSIVIGYRKNNFGIEALINKNKLYGSYIVDNVSLEDIMLFYVKGE